MPRALIDTSVLFAAAYRADQSHEAAMPIVRGIDGGSLPEAVVLDHVLAETLSGLHSHAGHDAAVDFLDRIEDNPRFQIDSLTSDARATAKALFRRYDTFSFVDSCIVAYIDREAVNYLYAFDDDFDAVDDITRLDTATDPFEPT